MCVRVRDRACVCRCVCRCRKHSALGAPELTISDLASDETITVGSYIYVSFRSANALCKTRKPTSKRHTEDGGGKGIRTERDRQRQRQTERQRG